MPATKKEKMKAKILRMKVILFPKYLISTGRVTTPTIISVEIKAPICIYPAPPSRSMAAVGKATNPGMRVIDPTIEARMTPNQPESEPIILDMISGLITAINMPTKRITTKNSGRMFSNAFHAFLMAIFVFFLSLIWDKSKRLRVIAYRPAFKKSPAFH